MAKRQVRAKASRTNQRGAETVRGADASQTASRSRTSGRPAKRQRGAETPGAEASPVERPRRGSRSKRSADEPKSEATRRLLLERALVLFQKRGVEATTMRDIAKAAGLSLGAAYYYFPSKDALVFAYYEQNQKEMDAIAEGAMGNLRERLGVLFHRKLETIKPQRKMLAAIVQRLADPGDPLSAFSQQTRAVRDRAIGLYARALEGEHLPPELVELAAHALWLFMLATMLVYVNDDSDDQSRTHGLVDDALDLIVPLAPLLATPMGRAIAGRVVESLARAGMDVRQRVNAEK